MARLFPLFFLIDVALVVIALISCLSADESDLRALPKIAWVFIILLFSPVGPIAYFVAGRPITTTPKGHAWRPGSGFPEAERPHPSRQLAPDDDPEFLRGLSTSNRDDQEMMRRWEADLRRREEELRRKEKGQDRPADD